MAEEKEKNVVALELTFNDDKLQTQLNTSLKMIEQEAVKTSENVVSKATQSINAIGNKAVAAAKNAGIKAATTAKETSKTVKSEAESVNQKINAILSDSNRSMKSKASSIASIYKKQGMDGSTAFKKAWEQIERTSKVSSNNINKTVDGVASNMANEFNVAAKKSTSSLNSFSKSATNIFGGIAKMAIAAFSVTAVTRFTKSCLELGSNLTEVQNVVDTAFKTMSSEADSFAKSAMTNFGMSELSAKKYLGVFGQMSSAMGMSERASLDMAKSVTALTGDVASFYNLNLDEAYTKLKSIWTGETESLKDLGVIMTQTNLDQYALNNGFGKTTAKMTEQEKLMLRFQYVTSSLSNASGDFIKTQNSWANQTRILSLRFEQLKSTLGQSFIALFTPIVQGLNSCVAGLQKLAEAFNDVVTSITGSSASTGVLNEGMSQIGDDALAAASNITAMGEATAAASNLAERSLAGFDKITKLGDTSAASTGSISAAGNTSSGSNSKKEDSSAKTLTMFEGLNFNKVTASFERLKEAVKPLTDKVFDGLKWAYDEIFVPFAKWTINEAVPTFLDALSQALKTLDDVLEVLKPYADVLWEKLLEPIAKWTGGAFIDILNGITKALEYLSEYINSQKQRFDEILNTYIAPFCDSLVKLVNEAVALIKNIVTPLIPIIAPIIEGVAKITRELFAGIVKAIQGVIDILTGVIEFLNGVFTADWQKCLDGLNDILKGAIEVLWGVIKAVAGTIINIVDALVDSIVELFKWCINLIVGIFSGLSDLLGDIFAKAFIAIKDVFSGTGAFFAGVWSSIQNAFGNVVNWFRQQFNAAAESIRNIFSGVFNSLVTIVKTPINTIIGMLNGMLSGFTKGVNAMVGAVNKISFKVPDWVPGIGGNSVGFNIATVSTPKIPMLAQGAYVEANTPQLAMIGDNRHQGEFVAPEDKLAQMAVDAAQMSSNSSAALLAEAVRILKEILKILKELDVDIQIDGESVKKKIVDLINENTRATGKCEIVT